MKVCLICLEVFAFGKYGGFGRATRIIGRELVKKGGDVSVVVPRRNEQREIEELDGMKVYGYPIYQPWKMVRFFRKIDAEVYHSEEPSFATYLAAKTMGINKQVVTFRDVRTFQDWWIEFSHPSRSKSQVFSNFLFEDSFLVRKTCQKIKHLYCAANLLKEKALAKYHLKEEPPLLPTPVFVPQEVQKAEKPTVCFIGRWDRVKRPQLFLELADQFPEVDFIATGASQDKEEDAALRRRYSDVPNLKMTGMIDQFRSNELQKILEKS